MWPILFLSRLLTQVEKNYWPTELEIARFIWVIKKLRHLVESSRTKVIIRTDHTAIFDIMQQSMITSTSSTMRINIRFVRVSQFLHQFRLVMRHKPGKEYIIPNVLSKLASANDTFQDDVYSEFDSFFVYHTTLVKINPDLGKCILDRYAADSWWTRVHKQILDNEELDSNIVILSFVVADSLPFNSNPYFQPRTEVSERVSQDLDINDSFLLTKKDRPVAPTTNRSQLIYHLNHVNGICHLCILPTVAAELLSIAHGKGHPGFSRCHEIIS